MKKILIAFLGKGQYSRTDYEIEDKIYNEQLSFVPILKHHSPIDKVYIIGTNESAWELTQDITYTPIKIPYGRSIEDFWKIFSILSNDLDIRKKEILFDITHCFRAIPFFIASYIRFINVVEPTAKVTHIFYGSYEQKNPITPIVDLIPVLKMHLWIDAATVFAHFGEVSDFASLVTKENKKIWKNMKIENKPRMLKKLSDRLGGLSEVSKMTYVPLLAKLSSEVADILKDEKLTEEIETHVKPFKPLLQKLTEQYSRFSIDSGWRSHLEVAKWYIEKEKITQALIVLRETMVTWSCINDKKDFNDPDIRKSKEDELNLQKYNNSPLYKIWQRVRNLRNDVSHALMGKDMKRSAKRALAQAEDVCIEVEKVLEELSQ